MTRPGLLTAKGKFAALTALLAIAAAIYMVASATTSAEPGRNSVTINYAGSISPSCTVLPGDVSIDFGTIAAGKTKSFSFGLDCNEPFIVELKSKNGGLLNAAKGDLRGFTNLVPYDIKLSLPNAAGSGETLVCGSEDLKSGGRRSCRFLRSGADISVGATATGQWSLRPTPGLPLIAGAYHDELTITVSPRGL